jgi:hypothetical protein
MMRFQFPPHYLRPVLLVLLSLLACTNANEMSVITTSIRPCIRSLARTSSLSSTVRHLQQSAVPQRQQAPLAVPDFAFAFE